MRPSESTRMGSPLRVISTSTQPLSEECLIAFVDPRQAAGRAPGDLEEQPHPGLLDRDVVPSRALRGMGRAGIEPATLGLRVPCSTS